MAEANCDIVDDGWLQMAIFRDPRPMAVSAYYHLQTHTHAIKGSVEQFVERALPIMTQWLAVRHKLFGETVSDRSALFWYTDAVDNPAAFHRLFLDSVGLQVPPSVIETAVDAALTNDFAFKTKKIDTHPGEEKQVGSKSRRFEDEVGQELLASAERTLRTWLPPELLVRLLTP